MANNNFDLRFTELANELRMLGEALQYLENQIHLLQEQELIQRDARLLKYDQNDDERVIEYQPYWEKTENIFPRFLRNPFLVTLWAVYESGVYELANYVSREKGIEIKLKDYENGKTFLNKAKKYFDRELKLPLCTDDPMYQKLNKIMAFRHLIAHSNGQIELITNPKLKQKIENLAKEDTDNIIIGREYIIFSKDFMQKSYENVKKSLNELMDRVIDEIPNGDWSR